MKLNLSSGAIAFVLGLTMACAAVVDARAQAAGVANSVGVIGQDSVSGLPCYIGPAGGSVTCVMPTGIVANDATFDDAAIGTIGSAPPTGADNISITVGGVMRNPTGVNPSGTVYAVQTDLSSIAGATVKTGNGTAAGSQRVSVASDNTPFHIIVDTAPTTAITAAALPLPAGAATAAKQDTGNTALAAIQTSAAASATAAKQPAPGVAGTPSLDVLTVQGDPAATPIPISPPANSYAHIATSATTLVKSGKGTLHAICVNTLGTVASAVTADDALTATTPNIAIINTLTGPQQCYLYDVDFATGLTIVTTGAPDLTISYR